MAATGDNNDLTFTNSQNGVSYVLHADPFRLEQYIDGHLTQVLNHLDSMYMENSVYYLSPKDPSDYDCDSGDLLADKVKRMSWNYRGTSWLYFFEKLFDFDGWASSFENSDLFDLKKFKKPISYAEMRQSYIDMN